MIELFMKTDHKKTCGNKILKGLRKYRLKKRMKSEKGERGRILWRWTRKDQEGIGMK